MLLASKSIEEINRLKAQMARTFDMKDLGAARQILGMEIFRDRSNGKLWLSQQRYIEKILLRFGMNNVKPVSVPLASHFKLSSSLCPNSDEEKDYMSRIPYANVVGCLMYAMVCTRPDISHAVGVVSRYMANSGKEHWSAVKWVLRYLRGTSSYCITYNKSSESVCGYVDSNLQVIWIREGQLQGMSLLLQVELLAGCQSYKTLLLYPLLKQNTLLLRMLVKRRFG